MPIDGCFGKALLHETAGEGDVFLFTKTEDGVAVRPRPFCFETKRMVCFAEKANATGEAH